MKTTVKWKGRRSFQGTTETGHSVLMDGPVKFGGDDTGPRPMELLLVGLGGCTAYDVVSILEKKRLDIIGLKVEIDADRTDTHPKIYSEIRVRFIISGRNISEKAVQQAIDLSEKKLCSASAMLRKSANIVTTYEIQELKS
ncbi:MAG: peroxiredoxin [Acidobacteria bacterium CG_4_9_14_3_um_filter_49_7]|nr:MAG: peroxiredoxin [Acidobacteria bacterium CG_4_9_14_3_um_filter_49_7]